MRRLGVLLCALCFGFGCASDSDKEWAEFWKDVRGENMQMKYDNLGRQGVSDPPTPTKSRD
jgi:hypothetical protein